MILVTGSTGQLGTELKKILGDKAIYLDRTLADFSKPEILRNQIRQYKFDYLINAAAYTQVDMAETERDLAMTVNATSVGVLAEVCREKKAKLAHISTDYVFPGTGDRPYDVNDATGPLNFYGRTKLIGEEIARSVLEDLLVIRTSWVWSQDGKNFVNSIIRSGFSKDKVFVVQDQFGSPTYAADLARVLIHLREERGTFHFCNRGETSWYNYALEIKKIASFKAEIIPVDTSFFSFPAVRPSFSCLKISNALDVDYLNDSWSERLASFLKI